VVCAVAVCLASVWVVPGAVARSPRFNPPTLRLVPEPVATSSHLPVLTAPQAIALLNQQRAANGIPGDLAEEPHLSTGCLSWATAYREAKGQYPHGELRSQPGYTTEGDDAASSSDLSGEPGSRFTVGALWGPLFNPWSGAALHEAGLMDPAITMAWYGASLGAACMGTSGARPVATPAFYSVPGPAAANVPIAENTGELPFSPQEAVGLGNAAYLAPAIPLWAEGTPGAKLQTATLASTAGAAVPTSLVTPETAAPQSPSGFPSVGAFGGYTSASFVVPRVRFKANTSYVLTAIWQTVAGSATQTVPFKTAATDLNGQIAAYERIAEQPVAQAGLPTGTITPSLHGRQLSIKASGIAIGQTVRLLIERCRTKRCMPRQVQIPWRLAVRLRSHVTNVTIPRLPTSLWSTINLTTRTFTVNGNRVYGQGTGVTLSG
jgi:hypothetical protein